MSAMRTTRRDAIAAGAAAALLPTAAAAQTAPEEPGFRDFLAQLRAEAVTAGIDGAIFDRAFAGVRFNARIIQLDRHQPEFTAPIQDYIAQRTTPETVAKGQQLLRQHAAWLGRAAERYKVPAEYVVSIWRMESGYGADTGSFRVVEALATLAFRGRRPDFWRQELLAALRLAQTGEVPPERLVGSWAGAMGQTQFMPSVYLSRAVDFDADGKRDLWRSLPDVFGSTANYLAQAGWQDGMPFGLEVTLPEKFPFEEAETVAKPAAEWARQGVALPGGGALPAWGAPATILLPAGHKGPALIVTPNYRALLDYNNAMSYALAVGLLAERYKGAGTIAKAWPVETPLSRTEKEEIQRRLQALGHDPGRIDGAIGSGTRAAIRAFQKKAGLPADGHANAELLAALRRAAP